jgi:chromosomal replication initiation ATPase DnaA
MSPYYIPGLKNKTPLKSTLGESMKKAHEIIQTTCNYFNVEYSSILRKDSHRDKVLVCQVSCYLIYKIVKKIPYRDAATLFGDRYMGKRGFDHSAIIYCKDTLQDLLDTDPRLKSDVDALLKLL